jgi:cation-transporting ATPase G
VGDACCGSAAAPPADHDGGPERFWDIPAVRRAILAGVLFATGLAADAGHAGGPAVGLYLAALAVGGSTFVPDTLRRLAQGRLGVGTLMTIAAAGAVVLGEFGEAASLAFLFSISEALEDYALARSRRGLRALLDLVPERVTIRRAGIEVIVAPDDVVVGDVMLIRPGERLPTDGTVRAGRSTLDVSAITGESVPIEAVPGLAVYAASINGTGVLEVEANVRTAESSLARVVHIVEEAQERKGAGQRLAERIARPMVPAIMVAAAAVALIGSLAGDPRLWIGRALVVLVAAAPCAFAISVPVTVIAAVGAASRAGALVKGGAALEALARTRIVALDKTGTLTRNRAAVIEVVPANGTAPQHVLAVAVALEARSDHPLATAILAAAPATPAETSDVHAVTGQGLTGQVDGAPARLGKPGFIQADGLAGEVGRLQRDGSTVVLVEHDGHLLGAIAVRDELRPEAATVVAQLRRLGMRRVVMLTGDNRDTAEALARQAGIDEAAAELLPEDKVRAIERLRADGEVAMVGDGINDAPALATADVGIAMGAMGSDVAIETADAALMGEELTHLPVVFAHARRAARIMHQNLLLSGAIIAVLIPLAALGVLGLGAVVASHEIAEVFVIANGLRAGRRPAEALTPTAPVPPVTPTPDHRVHRAAVR